MKPKFLRPLVSTLIFCASAALPNVASATDWYWDADGATTATTGGTGNWTLAGVLWRSGSATGTLTAYNDAGGPQNDSAANLILAGGTDTSVMTLSASTAYNFNKITANNTYSLATNTATGTFVGATPTVSVATNKTLTWGTDLSAASATVTKSGAGIWLWNNTGGQVTSNNTALDVTAGTLRYDTITSANLFTGTGGIVKVSAGTLSLVQTYAGGYVAARSWTLGSKVTLNGGTFNSGGSTGAFYMRLLGTTAIQVDAASTIAQSNGSFGQRIDIEGAVTGAGNLQLNRANAATSSNRFLNLKGDMSGYSGNVTIGTSTSAGYVIFGHSTGWGTGSLSLTGSGSRVVLGDEVGTVINSAWTGGSTLGYTSGTFAPAGTIALGASSELSLMNGTGYGILFSPTSGITLNGGTLSARGTSGTSAYIPATGSTWTVGGAASSTVSGNLQFDNSGVIFDVADAASGSDLFLSGTVTGSAGFTKNGAGALAFNGTTTISGQVIVNSGIIQINSTPTKSFTGGLSGAGTINVGGTGLVTLAGSSSGFTGTVNVADGASFAGEAVTAGSLVVGSTTGAKLYPDVSTPSAAYTASNVTLNGVSPILFVTQPPAGTYSILKYTGTLTGTAANLAANYRGALLNMGTGSNSEITLTLGSAVSLIWNNAAATSIWATGSEANWLNGAGNDVFYTADTVTFDDTPASNQDITITGAVVPASVIFNNSTRDYSISGDAISGVTSVVKGGAAMATLASANSYSGATTLNNGTLRVGDSAALGTAALAVNGGTLSSKDTSPISISNAITFNNNATLGNATDNGVVTLSGPISLTAGLDVTTNSDVILSGVVSGTGNYLGKKGTGTLTVTGTNTYGSSFVDGGTLQVGTGGAAGTIPGAATVTSPGTLRYFRNDAALTLANNFSGDGTLAFKGTGTSGQSGYVLTGSNSSHTGTLAIESGARISATTAAQLGSAANVNVSSGGQAFVTTATYANAFNIAGNGWTETNGQLGALRVTAGGNISGPVTLTADARISPYNSTGTLSGTLTGTNNLEINSTFNANYTGTLTYSGNGSAFIGATTVSQGTLNLTGSLGGAVNVSSTSYAATLSGEGTIAGNLTLGAVGFGANLTIDPTTSGALAATGTLNVAEVGTVVAVSFSPSLTSAGTYTVVTHGGTTATPANFSLAGTYRTPTFDTTTNPNAVTVSVSSANLTWKGNASTAWDLNTTSNWETPGPVSEKYFEFDAVTFNDSATSFAPTLAATVNPVSVTFNNSASDYTLTGAGVIAGSGTLTKSGTANVTLSTPNTYTGNVTVNGGKLILGNAAALGNSTAGAKTVTVNSGGQIDLNGQSPTARTYNFRVSGTGDGTGALVNSSATSITSNAGILNLELLDDATIGGTGRFDIGLANAVGGLITGNGKTLTKTGANQIQLRGDASATAINILVNQGTLGAETNDNALGGATGSVTVASGAILGSFGVRSIATPVTLDSGSTLRNLGGGAGTWTGTVATSGSVTVNPAGQTINLSGTVSGTGTITVPAAGGILNLSGTNSFNGGLIITDLTNNTATTVNLPGTSSLSVASGKPIRVGNNTGTGAFNAQTFNVAGAVTNDGTLFVGRSGNLNVNTGATWTQNGDMTVAGQGGYSATMSVNSGTTFTYAGTSTIKIDPGSSGFGNLFIDGLFTTSRGFETTVVGGATYQVTLRNGGTLKLSANISDLTTGATNKTQFALGTGGGIIDTNGFDAGLSRAITGTGNSLTKQGGGRLTLSGINVYTGPTTVTGGTLAGTGNSVSALTVQIGAALAPGVSVGTFASATATFDNGSSLLAQLDTSASSADKLVASGNVTIGTGVTLSVADIAGTPAVLTLGTELVLIDYTGFALTGTFAGLAEGAEITVGVNKFLIAYNDTSRVTLTANGAAGGYDSWSAQITNGKTLRTQDADDDGFTNLQEFLFGTNPMVSNGTLVSMTNSGGTLVLRWLQRESGATYTLQESTTLSGWTTLVSPVPALDGDQTGAPTDYDYYKVTLTIGAGNDFFRVQGVEN